MPPCSVKLPIVPNAQTASAHQSWEKLSICRRISSGYVTHIMCNWWWITPFIGLTSISFSFLVDYVARENACQYSMYINMFFFKSNLKASFQTPMFGNLEYICSKECLVLLQLLQKQGDHLKHCPGRPPTLEGGGGATCWSTHSLITHFSNTLFNIHLQTVCVICQPTETRPPPLNISLWQCNSFTCLPPAAPQFHQHLLCCHMSTCSRIDSDGDAPCEDSHLSWNGQLTVIEHRGDISQYR